ncbi:(2Fe-2S)-binding protein (plasmid) [Haloferax mediterranei ATCC 33500]|uniref:(2Fe-2S)-binding protein n=1 Tax=Haloferax mediterranei (strain ATCC 33500 / DSM 1411 / JCM 8866 / NBRC 14739 / NCIMB 2177 / R-4) TaxID=523841 RepID=I3RAE9_HALMT|nr:2Fe-2S iron-sulfur cluster-binding protein [Haloferax mediterranei]AFK21209.1 ferredoxin I [Haloferax mediterranei ATCC 33500]AHZ24681.1 (2Fe-2S)-binding protein [Haloferax mediterranei ATCC 33500]ELZ97457.1 ferredoxin I [Haloferax mediterranei ATCC 33500]MDX5990252.1 2Fe-2S iron-sulfur cluster-binding protein [Haloferax mediterranei ATCC 33500]QCQ76681.1 (2Fe-2S)-binding protein [Haloferax mediterranei ATCC 33500]
MPTIEFKGETIEADVGDNLRQTLLDAGLSPHNGKAQYTNCRGNALCGTCAVEIVEGDVSNPTGKERRRLKLPPHSLDSGLRLSCQLTIEDDLVVEKHPGYWGQKIEQNDS